MKKRGEITTQQLVILIVLIIGFAIILFLLFKLNLGKESNADICHNSVMNKATLIKTTSTGDAVPLDCKRNYICLTQDGTCESMYQPTIVKVKTTDDVYKALSTDLTDCWWMFGEGKVNYLSKELTSSLYCSICSNVAFDDSMKKIFPDNKIDKKNLYEYMVKNKMPEKAITYFEYLYNTNDINYVFGDAVSKGLQLGNLNLSEQYLVMTAVSSKISELMWGGIGAVAGVVAIGVIAATIGVSAPAILIIGVAGGGGYAGATVLSPVIDTFFGAKIMPPFFIGTTSDDLARFKEMGCEDIETTA